MTQQVIPTDPSYPNKFDAEEGVLLPTTVKRIHGCANCEWRGTNLCAFDLKKGQGYKPTKTRHSEGICKERENFLLSFAPPGKKHLTYTAWKDAFNDVMGQVQMHKDFSKLLRIEGRITQAEIDKIPKDSKDYKLLEKERFKAKAEWAGMWNSLRHWADKKLNREVNKEFNDDIRKKITIRDINQIIREGEAVDADYKEVQEESEGDSKQTQGNSSP